MITFGFQICWSEVLQLSFVTSRWKYRFHFGHDSPICRDDKIVSCQPNAKNDRKMIVVKLPWKYLLTIWPNVLDLLHDKPKLVERPTSTSSSLRLPIDLKLKYKM